MFIPRKIKKNILDDALVFLSVGRYVTTTTTTTTTSSSAALKKISIFFSYMYPCERTISSAPFMAQSLQISG
jgi:hypothetical protein